MREIDASVLLVREGVSPDPSLLKEYGEMFAEWAEDNDDVAYLDGAAVLARPSFESAFLDDCHLTRSGHQTLALAIAQTLQEQGWLTQAP